MQSTINKKIRNIITEESTYVIAIIVGIIFIGGLIVGNPLKGAGVALYVLLAQVATRSAIQGKTFGKFAWVGLFIPIPVIASRIGNIDIGIILGGIPAALYCLDRMFFHKNSNSKNDLDKSHTYNKEDWFYTSDGKALHPLLGLSAHSIDNVTLKAQCATCNNPALITGGFYDNKKTRSECFFRATCLKCYYLSNTMNNFYSMTKVANEAGLYIYDVSAINCVNVVGKCGKCDCDLLIRLDQDKEEKEKSKEKSLCVKVQMLCPQCHEENKKVKSLIGNIAR